MLQKKGGLLNHLLYPDWIIKYICFAQSLSAMSTQRLVHEGGVNQMILCILNLEL
jgi:hypothetical protein